MRPGNPLQPERSQHEPQLKFRQTLGVRNHRATLQSASNVVPARRMTARAVGSGELGG